MKVILTESQFNSILTEEMVMRSLLAEGKNLDGIIRKLVNLAIASTVNMMGIYGMIHQLNLPPQEEAYVKQEVVKQVKQKPQQQDSAKMLADSVALTQVSQDTIPQTREEDEWQCLTDSSIVTVYNAVPSQCNSDPSHTSSMFHLDMNHPESHRIVAMDRVFMSNHNIQFGDVIKIEGTYKGKQDGYYQVQDRMNARFKGMPKVDVLVDNNTHYGGTDKGKFAKIYILKNKNNASKYKQGMKPSLPR